MQIRGDEVDYVFIQETSHLNNVAEYMAYYNLKGKEYRARLEKWMKDNNVIEIRYKGEEKKTGGDTIFYQLLDIKEFHAYSTYKKMGDYYNYTISKLKSLGYLVHTSWGWKWKTDKTINTITKEILGV